LKRCSNKKGSLADVITVLVFPIILVMIIMGVYIGYRATSDSLTAVALESNYEAMEIPAEDFEKEADRFFAFWDVLLVFMAFGLWIGIMVVSYLLGNNPLFTFLYVIGSFGLIVIAGTLWIVMNYFITDATLGAYMVDFPITIFFFQHFYVFALLSIIGIGIALYMKPTEGGVL